MSIPTINCLRPTTFTVHVDVATACDLEKSFSFNKIVEITAYVHSPLHM